jgi:hypothetical protein
VGRVGWKTKSQRAVDATASAVIELRLNGSMNVNVVDGIRRLMSLSQRSKHSNCASSETVVHGELGRTLTVNCGDFEG